jgi:hypothetical protein
VTTFTLTLDLSDHEHPENPRAQRSFILQMLILAGQAIGASEAMAGELTAGGAFAQQKIGSWELDSTDLQQVLKRA